MWKGKEKRSQKLVCKTTNKKKGKWKMGGESTNGGRSSIDESTHNIQLIIASRQCKTREEDGGGKEREQVIVCKLLKLLF